MKYIKFGTYTGSENMEIDSRLLDNAIKTGEKEAIFRLYGWSPKCISLGKNQRNDFLNGVKNIDCVRRLTGGRALLHDNEITYSCIAPIASILGGTSVIESYKYISGILINFFKTLGIKLDFGENKKSGMHCNYCMLLSTGADVCFHGKKIIGSAQCRKQGYILQHGSILFGYDKELLESLFHEEVKGISTVGEILPELSREEFTSRFEDYIDVVCK